MFRNYFKIMTRHLLKNKGYLGINILGLTVAIACFILSISYAVREFSFDNFHSKGHRIYRLDKKNVSQTTGEENLNAETSGMMGITMVREFPEVASCVRLQPWWDPVLISYNDKSFNAQPWVFADSSFFSVFDFKLLRGDPQRVLANPLSIVLTDSFAKKLFGNSDPVGQSVTGMNELQYTVTGIAADPPANSHIQFDVLVSWSTTVPGVGPLEYSFMNNWLGQTIYTYLLLEDHADASQLQSKFEDFMKRNFPERASSYFLFLKPFGKVYLYSYNYLFQRFLHGSIQQLSIFLVISLIVLLIACFNYVNINTAKATLRASEVSVRKIMGANKFQLITQFLGESYVITLISLALAVFLVDLFLPFFNEITGSSMISADLLNPYVLLSILGLFLIVGLMAGLYPAFLLAALNPSRMLKSNSGSQSVGSRPRQVLTTLQFAVSIGLIALSVIIIKQYKFLRNHDLGFQKDRVLVISTDNGVGEKADAFKNELLKNPDILSVSICQAAMGTGNFGSTVIPEGMTEEMSTQIFRVDKDFIDTYRMELKEGRWFNSELDTGFSIVVNETFVKMAGWKNPLQMTIDNGGGPRIPVIGVIGDFHYRPLNEVKIDPVLMYLDNRRSNASVRISGNNIQLTLEYMEDVFKRFEKRHPFEYYFVDQWFDQQYKAQSRFLQIISLFTSISIILACLGLYGLTSFTISQRIKEIGIRKVLGASVSHILILVNRKFFTLFLIAMLMAIPIAYWAGNSWLMDFPYRIKVNPLIFVVAAIMAMLISALAVSIQSFRAAITNPSKILKQE